MNRYRDAYRIGRTTTAMGATIKVIGFILGGLSVLSSLTAMRMVGFSALITGLFFGAIVALAFWIFGVIVAAQGQILLATLDSAVSSSPFLTDEQRASAMGVAIQ